MFISVQDISGWSTNFSNPAIDLKPGRGHGGGGGGRDEMGGGRSGNAAMKMEPGRKREESTSIPFFFLFFFFLLRMANRAWPTADVIMQMS